jgi:DNA-binding transcriptional regulator LsrR (DeoR family)
MAARGLKPIQLVEAAAIARRYLLEGQSKMEIGQEFGISRFKVSACRRRLTRSSPIASGPPMRSGTRSS